MRHRRCACWKASGEFMSRQIKRLAAEEKQKARELYERIFDEDSVGFVEYYFQNKAANNTIYAVEEKGKILSMLHLNPYPMQVFGRQQDTAYIVAVATREECRHQGMMASLLKTSLGDLYDQKSPFAWLMPAAEAIYRPFGFRYLYSKNQMFLDWEACKKIEDESETEEREANRTAVQDNKDFVKISCQTAAQEDVAALADFAGQQLPHIAHVYTKHDGAYFRDLIKSVESDGGRLVMFMREGEVCGYFLASEEAKEAWEILVSRECSKAAPAKILEWFQAGKRDKIKLLAFPKEWEMERVKENPAIMGRIVHLETFVKNWRLPEKRNWTLKLQDDVIPENNGYFRIEIGPETGNIERLSGWREGMREMEIGQLQKELFCVPVFLNELV